MAKTLYIFDGGNARIVQRDPTDLSYISQLTGFIGITYKSIGYFNYPEGITNDGTYYYITDLYNSPHAVAKFRISDDSLVAYVDEQYAPMMGSSYTFINPKGIACDGTYLYICNNGRGEIVKLLSSDLSYVNKFGSVGGGDDSFNSPSGIETDGTYLYICDSLNGRLKKHLNSDLSYVSQVLASQGSVYGWVSPDGVAIDATHIYLTDNTNHSVQKRLLTDLTFISEVGSIGSGNDNFNVPIGVAIDDTYFYVSDSNNSRIHKRLKADLSYISQCSNVMYPNRLTMISSTLYDADGGSALIKIASSDMSVVSTKNFFTDFFSGDLLFSDPIGVSYDSSHIYIIDDDNSQLIKSTLVDDIANTVYVDNLAVFDRDGTPDSITWPKAIATDGTYLYVSEAAWPRIIKFLSSDLSYVTQNGTLSNAPNGLATDGTYLYAAMATGVSSGSIQRFNVSDLSYVDEVDTSPLRPQSVFYNNGNIYYVASPGGG